MTKALPVIRGINKKGFSGMRRMVASLNFSCTLIANRPQALTGNPAKRLALI